MHEPNKTPIHQDIYSFKVNLVFSVKIRTVLCCCHETASSTLTVLAREQAVYGQDTRESSYPKLCGRKTVMSPEIFCQVAQNADFCRTKFYYAQQHPNIHITHSSGLFRLIKDKERQVVFIYLVCFISSRLKERGILHI